MRKILVLVAILAASGCMVPPDVKDKVQTEVAVHDGYMRLIKTNPDLTKEDLTKMVKASTRAWKTLDHRVNDAPLPVE